MSSISRLALIAVAIAGIAAPAFAQSYHPVARHGHINAATAQSGRNAFAMVPAGEVGTVLSPAATGGGSVGYNENLRRDQW
jgi:hypothetical protein